MLALGGGALVGIACFLPLFSLTITFGALQSSGNVHATDLTSGKVALVLAFASLLLAVIDIRGGDGTRNTSDVGCLGAAIVVYKSWTLTSKGNGAGVSFAHVSMGVGMWVALIGGGVALASDFVGRE